MFPTKKNYITCFSFTNYRWDLNCVPEYCSEKVEIIFSVLRDTILETGEKAFTYQGRSVTNHIVKIVNHTTLNYIICYQLLTIHLTIVHVVTYLIQWLDLLKSMLREAEWSSEKSTPSLEDYVENAYVSFALGPIVLPATYLIGPPMSEETVGSPEYNQLYKLMSTMGRLLNDIQGFKVTLAA